MVHLILDSREREIGGTKTAVFMVSVITNGKPIAPIRESTEGDRRCRATPLFY